MAAIAAGHAIGRGEAGLMQEAPAQTSRWLDGIRPYGFLVALCLLLYLPGITAIPPLDRDEARFAQATRQMLETGDFLRIRFQEEARNKKPAGIYWLQAASVSLFSTAESTAIWPYRLPSLLGATLAVLLTFAFGARLLRSGSDPPAARRTAFFAAVLLASSLALMAEAHIAKTDAALLAAMVAAQGALGLAYIRARAVGPVSAWIGAVFWLAQAAAVLLKGPAAPALAIVTAAALSIADRDWRWLRGLRPAAGLLFLTAVLVPWLVAVERATEGRFLADALGQDLAMKLIGPQESHGAPPFAYLLLSVATFWPGSLLLVPALLRGWRRLDMPVERFLIAWLVPAWALLELVPTKLPHYVLPLYPALAFLAAAALADGMAHGGWARWADIAVKTAWALVTAALATALIFLPLRFGGPVAAAILGAVLLLALAAAILYRRGAGPLAAAGFAVMAFAFIAAAGISVLPGLERLWLSRGAAGLVAQHPREVGAPLIAIGYSEPSLVFMLGSEVRLTTPRGGAEALGSGGDALVSNREEQMFRQALSARGLVPHPLGSAPGFDYSNGQRMVLTLYRVTPG
jgi:4-amino-4-deoxy-L-arabinose transferase-like glycosyltransferase